MNRRVLVVDGSNLARTVLKGYLKREVPDAVVDTAASGGEAAARLDAGERRYHLITTALLLPDMDGIDLCRTVRRSRVHRFAPVVVVSSDADERLSRGGFEAGVTEFFDKARGTEALGQFLKEFMQRNPGHVGRVLYAEDSRTAAVWGRRLMERHGLHVEHVTTAEEAMRRIAEAGLPDLVVTDFFLGGEATGEDLLRYIRTERRLSAQELPVLVVTGRSGDRHAEVLHRGANDFIEKPIIEEIMMARIRSLLLVRQTFAALQRQSDLMRRMALTDSLTGTRNKRYLLEAGGEFLSDGHRPVAVLLSDIDHFKRINDTHGHLSGDRVLSGVGKALMALFPEAQGNRVCRFGGEEFVVLLPRTGRAAALEAGERLRLAMAELHPGNIAVASSVGVVSSEIHPDAGIERLVALADEALYGAKQGGRNCVFEASANGPVRV